MSRPNIHVPLRYTETRTETEIGIEPPIAVSYLSRSFFTLTEGTEVECPTHNSLVAILHTSKTVGPYGRFTRSMELDKNVERWMIISFIDGHDVVYELQDGDRIMVICEPQPYGNTVLVDLPSAMYSPERFEELRLISIGQRWDGSLDRPPILRKFIPCTTKQK